MPDAEKLLDRMRQTKSGWKPDDFERLYKGFGFKMEQGANHTTYTHAEYGDLITQVARHFTKELKPHYARTAVQNIDEVIARNAAAEAARQSASQ